MRPALFLVALAVDFFLGEPANALHPVVWMGKVIGRFSKIGLGLSSKQQLAFGGFMALATPAAFCLLGYVVGLTAIPSPIAFILQIWLLKSTFAVRGLGRAAYAVRDALLQGDLPSARAGLGSLCSREATHLDEPLIVAATVESVAENASDSFIAPLCFFAAFGLAGALFYRTVNTLDSMVGYHGKYEYLGKASARLDDLLNFFPARLTALLLLWAGFFLRADAANGLRMWRRDAASTESPNAGRPMATMAGLLRVALVKVDHYSLGDGLEPLSPGKIDQACRMVGLASVLATTLYVVSAVVMAGYARGCGVELVR